MEKRKICLKMTLIGIAVIIFVAVVLSLNEYNREKEKVNLKKDILSITKKCVIDNVCQSDTVTIKTLKENKYVDDDLSKRLEGYKDDSFIIYSLRDVILKEED